MAHYEEDMNKRRQRREALRRQREAEQRRLKIALVCAAVVLVLCAMGLLLIVRNADPGAPETEVPQAQTLPEETKAISAFAAQQKNTATTIHIRAAGDLNVTDFSVQAGLAAHGYDFSRAFLDVAPILSEADLTVLNFEGNVVGEPYGSQRTSAPKEMLEGLRNAGVDLVQMANSAAINNGLIGLDTTLRAVREAGLIPLGAYATPADFRESKGYTLCDVQGIRVAFVAFTKGLGGKGMPQGNDDCVNLLYTDYATTYEKLDKEGITAILKDVEAEKPDITIAMLHWGSEYDDVVSKSQESIISLLQKNGVDVIIGTHPHTVQEIVFDQAAGTLIAYSLGDFFGDATGPGSNYSIILDVEITKDTSLGTTRVSGFSYTPIYTVKESEAVDGRRRVVRIDKAREAYLGNYVDKITAACDESMGYSMGRIQDRTDPPDPTEPTEAGKK